MASNKVSKGKRKFLIVPLALAAAFLLVLLSVGGFAFAASQETHDSFCASCHSQPETTFYQRSVAAQPTDLASFHTTQKTDCINCHSGQGITGRIQAELMGARNAFKWYTGTAVQPAVLNYAIGDENCLKCHPDVTSRNFQPKQQITIPGAQTGEREGEGRRNHWHAFLSRWQAAAPDVGNCVSCHSGHAVNTTAESGFMVPQQVSSQCDACHQVLRERED